MNDKARELVENLRDVDGWLCRTDREDTAHQRLLRETIAALEALLTSEPVDTATEREKAAKFMDEMGSYTIDDGVWVMTENGSRYCRLAARALRQQPVVGEEMVTPIALAMAGEYAKCYAATHDEPLTKGGFNVVVAGCRPAARAALAAALQQESKS